MTTAELRSFRLELRSALVTGAATIREREGLLLVLRDEHAVGVGEASPLAGFSQESLASCRDSLDAVVAAVRSGADPAELVSGLRGLPHARAALVGANSDLCARREGRCLARWLRGDALDRVAAHALVGGISRDETVTAAAKAMGFGYGAVKLKVGSVDPHVDIDRIRAVRGALGPGRRLRLDANAAWSVEAALRVLDAVADLGIDFCEEPVAGFEAMAQVQASTGVRCAVDESARDLAAVGEALDAGLKVVVVKPQAVGGADVALAMADAAKDAGAEVVVTSFLDSAVGVAHGVHVAAATGEEGPHGLATSDLFVRDVAPASLRFVSGEVSVADVVGIGVSL